jgi:CRISPR/Cas system CSM-associated protein Csm4 (group 5 of RAMP superfamily)
MYKEGRQFVVDTKKEIDGVIKDVKSIQTDAKGIFGFFRKLFRSEKAEKIKVGTNPVKPKQKKRVEFDENQIYAQVADALTKFFHAYNGLKNYAKEQEEIALTASGEEGQDIAIKLVIAQLQMEKLNEEMREYMVYHVPEEMKDLYSRVNKMVGHIANQQALARKAELDKKRKIAWQKRQRAEEIQDKILAVVITGLMIGWCWIMLMIVRSSSLLSWH